MGERKKNTNNFHLINWNTVCQTIDKGGLVIRNPYFMNETLGGELAW
jgi:hypothetical protein